MNKPTPVEPSRIEAFACGQCQLVYREKSEAAECCTCCECGFKYPKSGYGNMCGHCAYGNRLRAARAAVRRAEECLAAEKVRLDKLLTEKKPARGTAE
jgi:hypothetical protein